MDDFCIGQSINDPHFDRVDWILPKEGLTKEPCTRPACNPQVAFRGYSSESQRRLADALSWDYGVMHYNLVTKANLPVLRTYKYECNPSPRSLFGERRFLGAFLSTPSKYVTVVGLRLIGGDLRVYRIARQYPYHTHKELVSLGSELHGLYGEEIILYNYVSSNAYADLVHQGKNGWFGRSAMFNPSDLLENTAELVLVDPQTRTFLEPTSIPESGEIKPFPNNLPPQCSTSLPIR